MRSILSLLIVLLCTGTCASVGAASALPEPGMRIRLTARVPERERWIGPFVSVLNDTVMMREGDVNGALVTAPTLRVIRFEISRGDLPNGRRGAAVGFAMGAVLGAAAGYSAANGDNVLSGSAGPGFFALAGAVVFSVIGAAVGAGHGTLNPSEHWRALPLENLRGAQRP